MQNKSDKIVGVTNCFDHATPYFINYFKIIKIQDIDQLEIANCCSGKCTVILSRII